MPVDGEPFPAGFFDRVDGGPDVEFYSGPPLVTHIDEQPNGTGRSMKTANGIPGALTRPLQRGQDKRRRV
jgi:hypothetical protein